MLSLLERFRKRCDRYLRISYYNQCPGVSISHKAFIERSVLLQFDPLGVPTGGSISIEAGAHLSESVIITPYGGHVNIGRDVFIGPFCVLYGHGGLDIGDNTLIAMHCSVIASNHSFVRRDIPIREQSEINLGISIGEDVWIGSGVRILDGVSIGKGCVIGAGAVVNKSLPPYSIAVGVPAKVIGERK